MVNNVIGITCSFSLLNSRLTNESNIIPMNELGFTFFINTIIHCFAVCLCIFNLLCPPFNKCQVVYSFLFFIISGFKNS